ncbi:MAG: hypothetical protein JRK53_00345 [Deltaproteobacteria bacterium]|nr:hypothetical protein [Deltaproteobacteria bacterium]
MKKYLLMYLLFFLILAPFIVNAQSTVIICSESGENKGHCYQLVHPDGSVTWGEALNAAASLMYDGRLGHLATITSSDESGFIGSNFNFSNSNAIIGGYQEDNQSGPDIGWKWITGESWSFADWNTVGECEPNDGDSCGNIVEDNDENCLEIQDQSAGSARWNDGKCDSTSRFFLVEWDPPPADIPTLSFWGMFILFLLLAGSVFWLLRRKTTTI